MTDVPYPKGERVFIDPEPEPDRVLPPLLQSVAERQARQLVACQEQVRLLKQQLTELMLSEKQWRVREAAWTAERAGLLRRLGDKS